MRVKRIFIVMYAHCELETKIPANHQLTLQLPDTIPIGHAKVTIIYEMSEPIIFSYQMRFYSHLATATEKQWG